MQNEQEGVLVDMKYEIDKGLEKVIAVNVRNIINKIVGEAVEFPNPMYKLAFAANFLTMLEQERNEK
jgi:hypothetical protein